MQPANAAHGYQPGRPHLFHMPDFAVFSADDEAGRIETITAADAAEAAAKAVADHPGAVTSVVPAEALAGCNRTKLLWNWMSTVVSSEPSPHP